jgi:hypothetical protein
MQKITRRTGRLMFISRPVLLHLFLAQAARLGAYGHEHSEVDLVRPIRRHGARHTVIAQSVECRC